MAEPLFLTVKDARRALGNVCETSFWDMVKRGVFTISYCGRKALVQYSEVKALARRIEAGELAPAHKGFRNHSAAIAKSIASRRRKAQVRAALAAGAASSKIGDPPDPPPGGPTAGGSHDRRP
jgi:hypothetical protein